MDKRLIFFFVFVIYIESLARSVKGTELVRSVSVDHTSGKLSPAINRQHIKVNPLPYHTKHPSGGSSGDHFINSWESEARGKGLTGISMDGYCLYSSLERSGELKHMILMLTEAGISGTSMKKIIIEYCNKNAFKRESSLSMEIFEKFALNKIERTVKSSEPKEPFIEPTKSSIEQRSSEDITRELLDGIKSHSYDEVKKVEDEYGISEESFDFHGD
jgi:hypothetical protein